MIRLVEITIAAVSSSFTGVDEMLPLKGGRESRVCAQSREVVILTVKTLSIKVRKNRQRKCATCFATLLQNKSNSDVSRVTIHESNLKCCC